MKKVIRKLVLRTETLRGLSSTELARVGGGLQSTDKPCRPVVAYDTGDAFCIALAVATAVSAVCG
jgi:hypothetical protein